MNPSYVLPLAKKSMIHHREQPYSILDNVHYSESFFLLDGWKRSHHKQDNASLLEKGVNASSNLDATLIELKNFLLNQIELNRPISD